MIKAALCYKNRIDPLGIYIIAINLTNVAIAQGEEHVEDYRFIAIPYHIKIHT